MRQTNTLLELDRVLFYHFRYLESNILFIMKTLLLFEGVEKLAFSVCPTDVLCMCIVCVLYVYCMGQLAN